eukprot:24769_1
MQSLRAQFEMLDALHSQKTFSTLNASAPVNQVQDVWNHCVSDMINKALDAKDYLGKYMDDNDPENHVYIQKYIQCSKNVTGLLTNLRFISCDLVSMNEFSLWTRVKWNQYYSEFHFHQSPSEIQIRLNILSIDTYHCFINGSLSQRFDDRLIFTVLDFLPRTIDDGKNHTLLLENYQFKNSIKGRDVDRLQQIANRCKVPVESMYYMLDIFELFHKDAKWVEYIKAKMHQQRKHDIAEHIASIRESDT